MTSEEKDRIIKFVRTYDEIHDQMDLMQETINNMVEKRNTLVERVDELKEQEEEFLTGLVEKYGPSAVTPNKLMDIARCSP